MKETGIISRISLIYAEGSDVCPGLLGKPLGFENCIGAFAVMVTGIATGFLLLMSEVILKKMSKYGTDASNTRRPFLVPYLE